MENKDLSRDFAIIFGIKPEEVPNNSSGIDDKWNELKVQALIKDTILDSAYMLKILMSGNREEFEDLMKTIKEGQANNIKNKVFKEQVEELKKYSEMESSKTNDTYKLVNNMQAINPIDTSDISYHPFPKSLNEQTGEKEIPKDQYIITFKKDKQPLIISKNMFDSLCEYAGKSNVNGYNIVSSLLFATDTDTGEMLCLDSSSILSIVKYK